MKRHGIDVSTRTVTRDEGTNAHEAIPGDGDGCAAM